MTTNIADRASRTYATAANAQRAIEKVERNFGLEDLRGFIAVRTDGRFVAVVNLRPDQMHHAFMLANNGIVVCN